MEKWRDRGEIQNSLNKRSAVPNGLWYFVNFKLVDVSGCPVIVGKARGRCIPVRATNENAGAGMGGKYDYRLINFRSRIQPDLHQIEFNPNANTHDPSTMDSSELDCLKQQGFLGAYSCLSFAIPQPR